MNTCVLIHQRGPSCRKCQKASVLELQQALYPLQKNVGGDFQQHNAHEHELVTKVDGVLVDANVLGEAGCQGAGDVHAVKLEDEQAKEQQREDGRVDPGRRVSLT